MEQLNKLRVRKSLSGDEIRGQFTGIDSPENGSRSRIREAKWFLQILALARRFSSTSVWLWPPVPWAPIGRRVVAKALGCHVVTIRWCMV